MVFTTAMLRELMHGAARFSPGYCPDCDHFDAHAGVEPCAEKLLCPDCGNYTFYGLEQAFLHGFIRIHDTEEE